MQSDVYNDIPSQPYAAYPRVLLADPTQLAGGPMLTELNVCGLEVLAVGTVDEALSIVYDQHIDLALLELKFEDGDCLRLIAEIRKYNPRSRIVVHTLLADVRATVAVIKAGADDLLPKPLDAEFVVQFLVNGNRLGNNSLSSIPDVETVSRVHILTVFQRCNRNLSLASRQLCLHRRSLRRIMQRYRDEGVEDSDHLSGKSHRAWSPSQQLESG
ncbi:response regulator transcription factor [Rhizobium leguminosarum]|jgi:two-component system response regulator RegA|uniref:response regulator transcription factor n=1 Tax=Rhizobium leguminosarum TaxID=384 RepID=UPI0013C14AA1|nr:response regulator [Rhizobium leguminosarum]NEH97063.1 response regulator [Rhizobium leguminosarum]NEJ47221.1 response regulator [Rhizobium leguminosarum]NEJ50107.1 response regulator [Rhizobium leguminosarum]NKL82048.1 response regulator [Rhizobium leguminosarum bv. viciae]